VPSGGSGDDGPTACSGAAGAGAAAALVVAAWAYVEERSRLTTSTPGWASSHAATVFVFAVGHEVDDVAPLQVHDDGAVALPLAPRPVVDPHDARRRPRYVLELLDPAEQRVRAGGHGDEHGETGAGLAAQRIADGLVGPPEAVGRPGVLRSETGEALGEDPTGALWA
jgi:hypothetical protein